MGADHVCDPQSAECDFWKDGYLMFRNFSSTGWPMVISGAFTAIMVIIALAGVWISFSPVPYWDMWDGTLAFVLDIGDGQSHKWWAQHNEHRIVLSRILFYLDYAYFGGMSYLLIPLNVVFAGFAALIFFLFARHLSIEKGTRRSTLMIASVLFAGLLFSCMQYENFTWGFQSQFFLAQLLPLTALYLLSRSAGSQNTAYFILALILGAISSGAMANGVVILPIMVVYLVLIWQGWGRLLVTLLLAVAVPAIYFWDYVSVGGHGSISYSLATNPLGMLRFTFTYLGGPFYHLLQYHLDTRVLAANAGFLLTVVSAVIAFGQIRSKQRSPYVVALLCFLLYVGATAFGTAGGRSIFGIAGATAFRYTTPTIMAWAALILAILATAPKPSKGIRIAAWTGTVLICIQFLVYQVEQFTSQTERLFGRDLAALALELGVRDEYATMNVYPNVDHVGGLAARAKAQGLSVFGSYPLEGLFETQGQTLTTGDGSECIGSLDEVTEIDGDSNFMRLRGWIFDPATRSVPDFMTITNEQGVIIGAGVTGKHRPDVRDAIGRRAFAAGYGAYVTPLTPGMQIIAVGDDPQCRLSLTIPG
jgi:hypothetical protein